MTIDIPYASPPQGMKYFTLIGPHIDCMDEQYLVRTHQLFSNKDRIMYIFANAHEVVWINKGNVKNIQRKTIIKIHTM